MEQTANTMPAATLGQYKGLAFTRRVRPVSDKAVEADIGNLARVHAPFVPTDAPAARGMRVTLDFEGFLAGAPIPDSRMEKVTVVLGTGQLMPAAEDAVYGHCAGETFRFDFTYPAEFRVPELSGKTAQFEICLHTVERKQVPPVDDALAKSLGFADLDALRESLREKKRLSHEANADRIAGAALLDMAGANLTVELPAELLAQNAEYQMTQLRQRLRKSQMTMELYCKSAGLTPEQVREGYRREAERQLRAMLAVRAIAGTDDDEVVVVVHTQDVADLAPELLHIVAVALLAELAEAAEVLADLGGGDVHLLAQLVGGDADGAPLAELGEVAVVTGEAADDGIRDVFPFHGQVSLLKQSPRAGARFVCLLFSDSYCIVKWPVCQ